MDVLDVALGQAIRVRRRQVKLTQTALAERLKVTFQQVQKYERGANRVSFSTLVRIAQTLECSIDDLVKGIGDQGAPAASARQPPHLAAAETDELISAFASIRSKALRDSILNLAMTLARQDAGDDS